MSYDDAKIEEATLALLAMFAFEGCRTWKGYDWGVLDALHEKGLISNPRSRNRSVMLSEEARALGLAAAERLFGKGTAGNDGVTGSRIRM